MVKILFVCTGNICRSPTAEAVFRHEIQLLGLENDFTWDSAGTHDYHVGEQADPRTRQTARSRGIDMDDLRARQLRKADFEQFDMLLAMDEGHLRQMQTLAPPTMQSKLQLYLPYAGIQGIREVPDPYYKDQQAFEHVLDIIQEVTPKLVQRLQREF